MDLIPDPHRLLQLDATPSLAAWYASPLTQAQAAELQARARQEIQRTLTHGGNSYVPRLVEMIAGYWQDRTVSHDYRSLIATTPEPEQAMVELIYGQLLMSRKRVGAMQHLDRGFELATATLAPAAYFCVLRRHALLRHLALTPEGVASATLPDLLQEARVIQRLQRGGRTRVWHYTHDDTLG